MKAWEHPKTVHGVRLAWNSTCPVEGRVILEVLFPPILFMLK
jgi:hypothetical protein